MRNQSEFEVCKICDIQTVKQRKYYYCAAACLKMCLGDNTLSQEDIYGMLHEMTSDKDVWYADPDSVYRYLNNQGGYKRLSSITDNQYDATEWIVSSLIQQDNCAPMLVSGGKHWVVYAGYQMTPEGTPSGIYIKDPWPSTAALTFYPFTPYFFNDYFCKIDIPGHLKDKNEAFVYDGASKCVVINPIEKPRMGGCSFSDINVFKNDILSEDFRRFGFLDFSFIKKGGGVLEDILIYDVKDNPCILLSYLELRGELVLSAIDVSTNLVVGVMESNSENYKTFEYSFIQKELQRDFGINPTADEIKYCYDRKYCVSCFNPLLKVGDKVYNLLTKEVIDCDKFE